jgi:CheY-like chemotaxis protein
MNILIAENQNEVAEIIEFAIHEKFSGIIKIYFANTSTEAIELLSSTSFDLCICEHMIQPSNGLSVLKHILLNNLNTKFVLCTTVTLSNLPELYPTESILFNIIKPDIAEGISKIAEIFKNVEDSEDFINDSFIPITVEFLSHLEKTPAEIYIKVSDDKFIKCFNDNAPFTIEEKEKYQSKSIEILYIKKTFSRPTPETIISIGIDKVMQREDLHLSDKITKIHAQMIELVKFWVLIIVILISLPFVHGYFIVIPNPKE